MKNEPDEVVILVTMDTLYSLESAPLEQTIVNATSCYFGDPDFRQASTPGTIASTKWLFDERGMGFGWNNLVNSNTADAALGQVTRLMLVDGLRAKDALERVEKKKDPKGTLLVLRGANNFEKARARHVVFFADGDGRAIEPEDTGLIELAKEDGRGWVAPLRVLLSGVLPDETDTFTTTLTALTQQGTASFSPSTLTPSSPNTKRGQVGAFDYLVPTDLIFGEDAPKHGDRVDLRLQTELPEGGFSSGGGDVGVGSLLGSGESKGWGSFIVARPECAIATMSFSAGGGAGWHNANNVTSLEIPGAQTFLISMARAERVGADTAAEYVEESAPGFVITVQGALPATGSRMIYSPEQVTMSGTAVDGVPSSAYSASARDGEGSVGLWVERREDGSLRGRLDGSALYPGGSELEPSKASIEFISAPPGATGDAYQCF